MRLTDFGRKEKPLRRSERHSVYLDSVRVYSSAPDQVTLQIRTYGQVASRGVYRKIVSAALLGLEEARQLHTLLGQWLSAQEPQP